MPIFGTRQKSCANCGKDIDINARFCPYCGKPTEATLGPCPHCGQPVAANAKFCPKCGRPLGGDRPPDLRGNVWRKSPDEFATRVEPADLRGGAYKDLEVQPGQQVIILVDGRAEEGRVGPGRYTLDSFFDRVLTLGAGRRTTALLIDGGFVPLEFQVPKLYTRDDYEVTGRCVVGIQVANPVAFFVNVMKSERSVTTGDLRNFLFDEARDAVQDVVGRYDFRGLATGMSLKDQMAVAVEQHLNETLADSGLRFGGVRTVEVAHPRLDPLRRQWEEIRIAEEEALADRTQARNAKLAEVEKRKALWEAQLQAEAQETAELRAKARLYEERAEIYDDIRRAVLSDKMNQVKSDEDYRDFLADINKRQTLRQEQLDLLAEDFASHKEDRSKARAHAAYVAELERDYNRKQAELVWKTDFTLEQMASALKIEQQRLADEGVLNERRWQNDLAALLRSGEKADWQRAGQQKQEVFDRQREKDAQGHRQDLEKAQTLHRLELRAIETDAELTDKEKRLRASVETARYQQEVRDIQRAIEAADFNERRRQEQAELADDFGAAREGVNILDEMQRKKLARAEEARRIALEAEERARRIAREDELARKAAAHQQEMDRLAQERLAEEQRQKFEIDRLAALGQLGSEALIAASGPDQGAMLVSLARTKAMEGKSAEEILALAAENSPAVAAAFQEKFRAINEGKMGEREQALFERLLKVADETRAREAEERRQSEERLMEAKDKSEERISRLADKLADGQAAALSNLARGQAGSQPPVIVVPTGAGVPQVIQASGGTPQPGVSGAARVQVCPRCRVESPVGEKFCVNCGFNFYQT